MISQYEFKIASKCPIDDGPDHYSVIVRSRTTVLIENLLEVALEISKQELFQEELTASLARELQAEVTTIGYHSGVKTTCCAGLP